MKTEDQTPITVMVIHDDNASLEAVVPILKNEGYAVHCAPDGQDCVESARQAGPDLILMDVATAHTDGLETCRRLKADPVLQPIPVIFMISNSDSRSVEDLYRSGASDLIRKPSNPVELLARVDLLLTLRQTMGKIGEAQKLREVLEKAGGVCHSLNQPLQFVLGAVQILLMDMSPDDNCYKSLDRIREKVEQMGTITRKLTEVTLYRRKP